MSSEDTITRTWDSGGKSGLTLSSAGAAEPLSTVRAPHSARLVRAQWCVALATVALVVLAAFRLAFVDGLLRPVRIDGPSMAPAFLGAHYEVICGDCEFPFFCDAEHLPADGLAACPNCGCARNRLADARLHAADRVLIDRWPLLDRGIDRGEVVAARVPATTHGAAISHEPVIKRIAALPGERLAIKDGRLLVDGHAVRKSRHQWHAVRLLVHDNQFAPRKTKDLPPRWRAASSATRWSAAGSGFRIAPADADGGGYDWLEYQNCAGTANARLRGVVTTVRDNDSYNQGEVRRPLNAVADVAFSCRLRTSGVGRMAFLARDGERQFLLEIEPRRQVVLSEGGRTLFLRSFEMNLARRAIDIEFGLFDGQVLLAVEGRTIVHFPYEDDFNDKRNSSVAAGRPLAIGTRRLGLHVDRLRVWRNVFYLDPRGLAIPWIASQALGEMEYAMLGDNPPVSVDSRNWDPPGIPRGLLLGKVYQPFWSGRHQVR